MTVENAAPASGSILVVGGGIDHRHRAVAGPDDVGQARLGDTIELDIPMPVILIGAIGGMIMSGIDMVNRYKAEGRELTEAAIRHELVAAGHGDGCAELAAAPDGPHQAWLAELEGAAARAVEGEFEEQQAGSLELPHTALRWSSRPPMTTSAPVVPAASARRSNTRTAAAATSSGRAPSLSSSTSA